MGAELDRQGLPREKAWMLRNTEAFQRGGSSRALSSVMLSVAALTVALVQHVL